MCLNSFEYPSTRDAYFYGSGFSSDGDHYVVRTGRATKICFNKKQLCLKNEKNRTDEQSYANGITMFLFLKTARRRILGENPTSVRTPPVLETFARGGNETKQKTTAFFFLSRSDDDTEFSTSTHDNVRTVLSRVFFSPDSGFTVKRHCTTARVGKRTDVIFYATNTHTPRRAYDRKFDAVVRI